MLLSLTTLHLSTWNTLKLVTPNLLDGRYYSPTMIIKSNIERDGYITMQMALAGAAKQMPHLPQMVRNLNLHLKLSKQTGVMVT